MCVGFWDSKVIDISSVKALWAVNVFFFFSEILNLPYYNNNRNYVCVNGCVSMGILCALKN